MYYYQTFQPGPGVSRLVTDPEMEHVTDVLLSAVHFGRDPVTRKPYVHLNDHHPSKFEGLIADAQRLDSKVQIHLMIGGAGGGLRDLVEHQDIFYPLLRSELLDLFPTVSGINLDVEEGGIAEKDFEQLVGRLHSDYPDMELSLAPVAEDLLVSPETSDNFSHAQFLTGPCADKISLLMVQCYGPRSFSNEMLDNILGGPLPLSEAKIVMGMESGQLGWLHQVSNAVSEMARHHPSAGGFYDWELYGATKGWARTVSEAANQARSSYCSLL